MKKTVYTIVCFVDTVDKTYGRKHTFGYACSVTSISETWYIYKTRNNRNVEGTDRVPF